MNPLFIFTVFILYSALLFVVTWFTSRKANNDTYYIGNKRSPWYVVAYGMLGASLSGVTFMSVPGSVAGSQFSYMLVVFGYFFGYFIIATVLMPMYYRLNLTSIYSYLEQRFGFWSYKTGAFFFILSRIIGASFRMYLVVNVLQIFIFDQWGIPFGAVVAIFILLIILYTFEGGVKTIVWTDTLQTTFMLLGVILSIYFILSELNINLADMFETVRNSKYSQMLFTDDWRDSRYFLKKFFGGIFIAIVMTGLDQEMMQKNLSCRNIKDAQKNMFTFSFILVLVNAMFLFLGAVLYIYAVSKSISIPVKSDDLFPVIAFKFLNPFAAVVFMLGLISAAYPSADGALTSLTTSFCVDFLGLKDKKNITEKKKKKIRYFVHFSFAGILLAVIMLFRIINNDAVVNSIFKAAGYTYGPLLGMFAFGLFTKFQIKDRYSWFVALLSPVICYFISLYSKEFLFGYVFDFELLILNGFITFIGFMIIRKKP